MALKCALADLGLIRRVGGEEFAAQQNRVGYNGAQVVVNARAQKAGIAVRIFGGARAKKCDNLGFRKRAGQIRAALFSRNSSGMDGKKSSIDRTPIGIQHFLALGGALREITHPA